MSRNSRDSKPRLRVVMLGPSLSTNSGISAMVNTWLLYGLGDRVRLVYISTLKHYKPHRRISKTMEALWAFASLFVQILFRRPDLIHFQVSYYNSFYRKRILSVLPRIFQVPYVMQVVSGGFEQFVTEHPRNTSSVRKVLDRAAAVVTMSKSWANVIKKYTSNRRMYTIYNTAAEKEFKKVGTPQRSNKVVVLFLGNLIPSKGLDDLLQAIPGVVTRSSNVLFRLCGYGDAERIRRIIAERGLENFVELLGKISDDEKYRQFLSADIYTLPSYFEGMPGSILEAMAAGLPVIATEVGGIPEQVIDGETGYLIQPGDVSSLTERLVRLCVDAERREKRHPSCSHQNFHHRAS